MLILYGTALSQPTRAVRILLDACDIEYEFRRVNLRGSEHRSDEFLRLNPNGKVPVLDDDGFLLHEAAAIMVYLCESRNLADWYPANCVRKRGVVNQWLHWVHTNTRIGTRSVFFPIMQNKEPSAKSLQALGDSLKVLNDALSDRDYLAVDLSIADIFACVDIDQLLILELFDFSPYPNVARWLNSMFEVDGYDSSAQSLRRLAAKRKSKGNL